MDSVGHVDGVRIGRVRSIDKAYQAAIAALRRPNARIIRQCRRAFLIHSRPTTRQLLEYCYPGQARKHWHYWSIYRALKRLSVANVLPKQR
jgi:hypothetical protein